MNTLKQQLGLRYSLVEMSTLEGALRYAERCIKAHCVILGDNGKFWIACFADAQRLVKAGYELAE